jgi:hypothetical protein
MVSMCGLVLLASMQGAVTATVDPRGPIEYPGMKVLANERGAQTPGFRFRNECRKPTPWQAQVDLDLVPAKPRRRSPCSARRSRWTEMPQGT